MGGNENGSRREARGRTVNQAGSELTGPVGSGVIRVIAGTRTVLGYAHTAPRSDGPGQLQRWLLYADPLNDFEVEEEAEMGSLELGTWRERVSTTEANGGLWRSGSYYIKACVDLYRHGESRAGHDWTTIPSPPPPSPPFPEPCDVSAGGRQVDPGGGKILQRRPGQRVFEGHVFSTASVNASESTEHWYLPDGFEPAGSAGLTTSITPEAGILAALFKLGVRSHPRPPKSPAALALRFVRRMRSAALETAADLGLPGAAAEHAQFIADMNRIWKPGDAFAVVGCCNYHGDAPPRYP